MNGSNALQIADPNADNPLAQAPSWADAAQSVAGTVSSGVDALGQWLAAQRAKSQQMGLWNDQTGLPTAKGLVSAAQQTGNALLMGTTAPGIRAFHGSPYDFERFDTSKIGTGEGAQAYGHGLYFAENEGVAKSYRDTPPAGTPSAQNIAQRLLGNTNASGDVMDEAAVTRSIRRVMPQITDDEIAAAIASARNKPAGSMYEVNIGADPEQFLHWDKPLSEQSPEVQKAVQRQIAANGFPDFDASKMTGEQAHNFIKEYVAPAGTPGKDELAVQALAKQGIPGIRYLDQGSRATGQGTHNYVVFDANTIDILRKYGLAGLGIGLSGAAAGTQGQPQQ